LKALIITYYWPPSGGSGVQRWLKFVKYLRNFQIEPVIYTVKNPNYAIEDITLQYEVPENIELICQSIWEPNNLFSLFGSKKKETSAGFLNPNPSFIGKLAQYIRANYFIPDARKYWIKPSVKYLTKYLKDNKIDIIITTGPPHSTHLIGLQLRKKLNIKWIADFRDPWTEIDYFHQLPLTKRSIEKHRQMEEEVLKNADTVLVVGKTMANSFKKFTKNIDVITNGYDSFEMEKEVRLDEKFSLVHIGMLNSDRNHKILWKVLQELCLENKEFAEDLQLKFIGKLAEDIMRDIEKYRLKDYTTFIDYLVHREVLQHQISAQVLLLSVNNVPSAKGIITGKIFEYLQANRPILAIGPTNGDLAEIINNTNSGIIIDFEDEIKLKEEILKLYANFKNNSLNVDSINIEQYHRKELTKQLAKIIKEVIE
jgi:glycosyltransferase involved in cell wall biosynthesis